MLTRQQKTEQVDALRAKVANASSLVAVDFRGMTVDNANALRAKLRAAGGKQIEYRVAKNTLLKIATRGTPHEPIARHLEGPTAIAIAFEEPSAMAKVLIAYAKENEKFRIKGGVVDGELVDTATIGRSRSPHQARAARHARRHAPVPAPQSRGDAAVLLGHLRNALEQRQQKLEGN
jgi:large subunit ribosomal protein L10